MNNQNHTQLPKKTRIYSSGRRAAREILLLCTTANLSPERKERISSLLSGNVDWKYLLDLAEFHGIAPLISRNFTVNDLNSRVSKPYLQRLNEIYNKTLYRNVILSDELTKILSAFNQRGIRVISLKGIALAEMLYENPALRTMSDMDILVQPDDLPRASSLLIEMGYKQLTSPVHQAHPFHGAPYYKQTTFPIFIELHWDLEDEKLMSTPMEKIWGRAQTLQLQWGKTMTLSFEDTLMFSIVQLCKQFDHLKVLGDIAELMKKYQRALDWRYIVDSAHSWGIGTGVYYSLKRAQDLLEAPVPPSVIKELKPKTWRRGIVEFLLSQEVFISPIKWYKLRMETLVLVRSLMMKHARQTLLVLEKYRGVGERGAWLRTAIWIILVFIAALGRHITGVISGRK